MNYRFVPIGSVAPILLTSALAAVGGTATRPLTGQIPAKTAAQKLVGPMDGDTILHISVGLDSRDPVALDQFIARLYDPSSPDFRHYLSTDQFAARFGPTDADYQRVLDFALTQGLTVVREYPNHLLVDIQGPVAQIQKAFGVTLHTYQDAAQGRTFFAPDIDPSIPADLPIVEINGLDTQSRPHSHHLRRADSPAITAQSASGTTAGVAHVNSFRAQGSAIPQQGSAPGNKGLWGNDFRHAYVPGSSLTGTGQSVGLLEFEGYYDTDINRYETDIGLSQNGRPQLIIVPVNGGATPADGGDNGEECSGDIEMVVSMAPGLDAIYIFETNTGTFNNLLQAMIAQTNILQFSCSWATDTLRHPTSEVLFKQMISQGQCFFNASGDAGAFVGAVEFPSDSPSVIQVGGTTLTDKPAPTYAWAGEVVWNWGVNRSGIYSGAGSGASGGGLSTYYTIPSWQTNINWTANGGSKTWRNVPDIAANADHCYLYTDNGSKTGGNGGTSFAAPLWAGFLALVNQQSLANGRPSVGYINPALYALASTPRYSTLFHDVSSGNNVWNKSPGLFYAKNGYDLCTGLGSMNGTNLINALTEPFAVNLVSAGRAGRNITAQFASWPRQNYSVQYQTSPSGANWLDYTNIIGTGPSQSILVPVTLFNGGPAGFVRVISK